MIIKHLPFALALLITPALMAQDYEIHLHRPAKAGDEYRIVTNVKQKQNVTLTSNGNPVQNVDTSLTLDVEGVEKVIEVDAIGRETKTTFTVEKFIKNEKGEDVVVFKKGSVINSSLVEKKKVHEIDGTPAVPAVAKLIDMIVTLSDGGHTDDDIFGTKDRKKSGDSWDMNTVAAKENLAKDMGGMLQDLTGKVTLNEVVKAQGGDLLKISAHVTSSFQPPLPPAFTTDSSSLEINFSGDFPVDPSKPRPSESIDTKASLNAHGVAPTGEKLVLKMDMDQAKSQKTTKLK